MAEKQAINQKVENVFNFSISQQIVIDSQHFLLLVNAYAQIEIAVTKQYRPFEMLEWKLVITPH